MKNGYRHVGKFRRTVYNSNEQYFLFHSMLAKDYPKTNTCKADVQKWLEKFCTFSPAVVHIVFLREKVKLTMPKEKNINSMKSRYKWAIKW